MVLAFKSRYQQGTGSEKRKKRKRDIRKGREGKGEGETGYRDYWRIGKAIAGAIKVVGLVPIRHSLWERRKEREKVREGKGEGQTSFIRSCFD